MKSQVTIIHGRISSSMQLSHPGQLSLGDGASFRG